MQTYRFNIKQYCRFDALRLVKPILICTIVSFLVSCGGGGTSSLGASNPSITISYLSPVGVVAPVTPLTLTIVGTNFSSGMSVTVTDKNGVGNPVTSVNALSSTTITANVTVNAAPVDNYLNVTVIPTNSTPPAKTVLGVSDTARTLLTDVQNILDSKCSACHTGAAPHYLDLSSSTVSASNLINESSVLCPSKLRVVPSDPRRNSSVLIDKIQASPAQPACSGTPMPPSGSTTLTAQEIQTIIDWVAGGAN